MHMFFVNSGSGHEGNTEEENNDYVVFKLNIGIRVGGG